MTAAAQPGAKPLVLVAEDNAISLTLIAHQLRTLGCEPVCAADGAEAATTWQRGGSFDLVLTDLQMPGLDGYALAALLRRDPRGTRLPIVALTAGGPEEEAARCRTAGIDACLAKPVGLDALRGVLDRWLAASRDRA